MPEETKDALEVGPYAALEGDDNSIDVSNDAYIGVDAEYRNAAAYDGVALDAPQDTPVEDDPATARLEQRAKDSAEALSNLDVNRAGHTPNEPRAGLGTLVVDGEVVPDPDVEQAPAAEAAAAEGGDGADDGATPEAPAPVEDDPSVASGYYAPPAGDPGE